MSKILRFHDTPHRRTQTLLPWYVNGTLEPEEARAVEAHVAGCAECQADLEQERVLGLEIARMPDIDRGWEALRGQIEGGPRPARRFSPRSLMGRSVSVGWAIVAQAACLALMIGAVWVLLPRLQPAPTYRVLGAPEASPVGNVVVMFEPTVPEQALRGALRAADARVVGGPTVTGAYVLQVDPAQRDRALTQLRARREVSLAEPIDGESRP